MNRKPNSPHSLEKKKHPLYYIWCGIIARCECKTCPEYPKYGGIGVQFDQEWRDDIEVFAEYLGPRPSRRHSVDRFPNKNGNYEPGNVRWATPLEQIGNRNKFKTGQQYALWQPIPAENKNALKELFVVYSVFDIAKILDISRQAVNNWEEVPIRTVGRLSKATGIPPEKLHPEPYY